MTYEELRRKTRNTVGATVIVYVFLVGIVIFLFADDNRKDEEALRLRCESQVEVREVQRSIVQAIYKLNLTFIDPSKEYTEEEILRIRRFVRNVTEFRSNMFRKIQPSDPCLPYVNDENVKPPPWPKIPEPHKKRG